MKLSKENLNLIKNYFKGQPVLKAYLFGSYVLGNANENSDIDILVELDYNESIGLHFVKMQLDLQSLLKKEVDLVSANAVSFRLKPLIDKHKQLIYAR